ncbi:CPK2 [Symbiodinium natans]|uniref:CPK2 protein n=1 Tax=Symbiodinium natans TaxID=878477 RepID=A0A812LIS5_9DINO|nr:CPK2 [Symbiodinium natans]
MALLQDCVTGSSWLLCGDSLPVLAARGSRPGDGLADVLFGAVMSCLIRELSRRLQHAGVGHGALQIALGEPEATICPIAWADDLVLLADVESAADLPPAARCMSNITLQTFSEFRLRVNLGAGKTELLVDPRGQGAATVRGELLQGPASLCLADGQQIRICPEYKYLGVPQVPRDTGRRDVELSVCRGRVAEVAAGPLLTNDHLPWPLRVAWIDGRVLPSAYSSLSTMLAPHPRCLTPLAGFLDRVRRKTWRTWQNARHATNAMLEILVPCTSPPAEGLLIARTRLLVQLCVSAPEPVWEIVEAAYYRDVPWVIALARAAKVVGMAASLGAGWLEQGLRTSVRRHARPLLAACKRVSRSGTLVRAIKDLWVTREVRSHRGTIGSACDSVCPECLQVLPSKHALATHLHRKHGKVSDSMSMITDTVCRWYLQDFHSTTRLRYHIEHVPACRSGLRHVVGPLYAPGVGTRRKGTARHLRVPPLQLPGPRLPTPCERAAAAADRYATPDELAAEQQSWMQLEQATADRAAQARAALLRDVPGVVLDTGRHCPAPPTWTRAWFISDHPAHPSPFWEGITAPGLWQAAASWSASWEVWARIAYEPWWSRTLWDALANLRLEAALQLPWDESTIRRGSNKESCTLERVSFIRHLVTMRRVLTALGPFGALWWVGSPTTAVRSVLASVDRSLLVRMVSLHGTCATLVSRWAGAVDRFRGWWSRPGVIARPLQLSPVHHAFRLTSAAAKMPFLASTSGPLKAQEGQKTFFQSARSLLQGWSEADLCVSAEDVSAYEVLHQMKSIGGMDPGAEEWYLAEGTQALAKRLAADLGAAVILSSPVSAISINGDRIYVTANDVTYSSKYIVIAIPPQLYAARRRWLGNLAWRL